MDNKLQNFLKLAESAIEGNNKEEALNYVNKVLEKDIENSQAWRLKGKALLGCSKYNDFNSKEVITSFRKALEYDHSDDLKQEIINCIHHYISNYNEKAGDSVKKQEEVWGFTVDTYYLTPSIENLRVLEFALNIDHNTKKIAELIVDISDDLTNKFKVDTETGGTGYYQLTQENREKVNSIRDKAVESLQKNDPNYQEPQNSTQTVKLSSSGCFVITATTGSDNNHIVKDYRSFRDDILVNSTIGRLLIAIYYRIGPKIAVLIKNNKYIRKKVLKYFVLPIHKLLKSN